MPIGSTVKPWREPSSSIASKATAGALPPAQFGEALLERVVGNGVRVVIVEDASRFARHLLTQEAGISLLVGLGVRVLTAAGDDLTDSDNEFRVAMREIMGVFSQLEKTRLVKKLKAARDRKRTNGKVEGRKSHLEARPEVVAEAKRLHRASPKTGRRARCAWPPQHQWPTLQRLVGQEHGRWAGPDAWGASSRRYCRGCRRVSWASIMRAERIRRKYAKTITEDRDQNGRKPNPLNP